VAVDIVNLIINMQLMARLGDLTAKMIIWPSTQVKEDAALTVFANVQVI
jgi:hypothetical protein